MKIPSKTILVIIRRENTRNERTMRIIEWRWWDLTISLRYWDNHQGSIDKSIWLCRSKLSTKIPPWFCNQF